MDRVRWAVAAWAALGFVVELPLAQAQADAPALCPQGDGEASAPSGCAAASRPLPSPVDVLLSGGGIFGSLVLLRGKSRPRRTRPAGA